MTDHIAIDLFSGCGGLSEGMRQAEFDVRIAVEIDNESILTYSLNHPSTHVIKNDIRNVDARTIKKVLNGKRVHLMAGCPPCQGFSSVRRLNRKNAVYDSRNRLILEYYRLVKALMPLTIMMENVPGLVNYYFFEQVVKDLREIGYNIDFDIVRIQDYGIPQRRRRLVLVGSLLGAIKIAVGNKQKVTVRDVIGNYEPIESTNDPAHKIVAQHTTRIRKMIALIPKDGGSRKDLPPEYTLQCHKKENVGFYDIYGRLRWDDYSSTITGGCLNPSKGRFLHPEKNRGISAREAALLQTFPKNYNFPVDKIKKASLALIIGNALPPQFSYLQCKNIKNHLEEYIG